MRFGRIIGNTFERIPGASTVIGRLRFNLRMDRQARRHLRGGGPERRYAEWVRRVDTPSRADLAMLRARAKSIRGRPVLSLLMVVGGDDAPQLDRTLPSILAQVYPDWELCVVATEATTAIRDVVDQHADFDPRVRVQHADRICSMSAARNLALEMARGDHVAMVSVGDEMPAHALFWIAEALCRRPDAGLVYADEDRIDDHGMRHDPWFKSDFNRELVLAHDAISRPAFYPRPLVRDLGGWRADYEGAEDHDLALRVVASVGAARVVHIPRILYHRGPAPLEDITPHPGSMDAGRRAVVDVLRRQASRAIVEAAPEAPECNRIRYPLPDVPPLVSIIICTRDNERLLRVAIESIVGRTTYPRYEILVVDNDSVEPRAVAYLADIATRPACRVIRDGGPFNYSRLNNRAASVANGEMLCLLNDDIEVITPDWLEELVSHAVQADVGAVGARLWYPDGTLQHGGVVVGICRAASHAHPRLRRGERGYFGRAVLQQEVSAVTGACLVVRAATFASSGGLDERLEVDFNDVDFCLRLRQAGYRNIWTPFAELIHCESASRGCDDTRRKRARAEREVNRLRARWGDVLLRDPFYNPNLSASAADFSVDVPPLLQSRRGA